MIGVDILAVEQVVTKYTFSTAAKVTILVIISLFVIVGICFAIRDSDISSVFCCVIAGIIVSLFIGGLVNEYTKKPLEYETRYKVLISDEVNFNEFNDKYDVLGQEGKIFIIRDRKVEETE